MTFSLKTWLAIAALLWGVAAPTSLWLLYDHEHKNALRSKAEATYEQGQAAIAFSNYAQTKSAYDKTKAAYDDAMKLNADLAASKDAEQAKVNFLTQSLTKATEAIKNAPGSSNAYVYSDSLYSLMRGEAGSGQSKPGSGGSTQADPAMVTK